MGAAPVSPEPAAAAPPTTQRSSVIPHENWRNVRTTAAKTRQPARDLGEDAVAVGLGPGRASGREPDLDPARTDPHRPAATSDTDAEGRRPVVRDDTLGGGAIALGWLRQRIAVVQSQWQSIPTTTTTGRSVPSRLTSNRPDCADEADAVERCRAAEGAVSGEQPAADPRSHEGRHRPRFDSLAIGRFLQAWLSK